jgi:hypothetical protein
MECCDCGLVHILNFRLARTLNGGNSIQLQVFRDNRKTAQTRRARGITMPLPKARKGAKKAARQKVASKVISKLAHEKPSTPKKQRIAIGLRQAGLSRRKSRKK